MTALIASFAVTNGVPCVFVKHKTRQLSVEEQIALYEALNKDSLANEAVLLYGCTFKRKNSVDNNYMPFPFVLT